MTKLMTKPVDIKFHSRAGVTPETYRKLNEGLGGAYERVAYTNVMRHIMQQYGVKSMLELNATYIAGVPGFNSVIFKQEGYDVTLSVRPRDYQDTVKAWRLVNLLDGMRIVKLDSDIETPFLDGGFDMVWNHLALDQYRDPLPLVKEMARISNKLVMNLTLTPYNYGFLLHKFMHWQQHKPWDHGYAKNAIIPTMQHIHRQAGLEPIEWGGVDCPPWMDTVDEHFGGDMTYMHSIINYLPIKQIHNRWIWCSANPKCREHWLVKLLWSWEEALPGWFKILMAHHLYIVSVKKG